MRFMSVDVDEVRRQTRGVRGVIHLNNAGSSLVPSAVMDAVVVIYAVRRRSVVMKRRRRQLTGWRACTPRWHG